MRADASLSALPLVVAYLLLTKQFVAGLSAGASARRLAGRETTVDAVMSEVLRDRLLDDVRWNRRGERE